MLEFVFSVRLTERERGINYCSKENWDLVPFTLIFLKNKTQIRKKRKEN